MIGLQAEMNIVPSKDIVHVTLPAMDLYNVTPHEALDALLHSNGYDWREKGKFIYVYSKKEIEEQEKATRIAKTEVFPLYYMPAADAKIMITPVLSKEAGEVAVTAPAKSGIASGAGDVGGDSHSGEDFLVVTDYPEKLDEVRALLKKIDHRPQQILVEATILRAALSEDNALGVDFNLVGGVDFSTLTNSSGQITNANLGGGGTFTGNSVNSVGTGNSFSSGVKSGFKVGVVTHDISVFLSALEGVTDTTIIGNPKVLALNKQKAEVFVGSDIGYYTTTTTETSSTQTVEFLKSGTRLIFRPYVADDGYIRMEVHPEDSAGSVDDKGLPSKFTTEVTSNVMVKDGRTIVIGGLFRESSDSSKSQIPFFGNLPLAGPLFRNQKDSTNREEVIILLTPHIVKDDEAYSDMSEKELKDAEKLRVGVRKGMMFWGRERLAEMNYEWAVSEMNKRHPNRHLALWNLDAATNLNPKFIEAIHMKQELTGKEITDSDNSSIRSFVSRAVILDRAPATQPATVLIPSPAPRPGRWRKCPWLNRSQRPSPRTRPSSKPIRNQKLSPRHSPSRRRKPRRNLKPSLRRNPLPNQSQRRNLPLSRPISAVADMDPDMDVDNRDEDAKPSAITELPTDEVTEAAGVDDTNK